jgi:beta-lactam-binding protein with PASTA domain/class 3 adenylate cyclase/tRNA A-37 threonylcarbamoyl transferase component Bud32
MINAPTSTVTFLFADVEGSISPSENDPTTWMRDALAHYDGILRKAADDNGGYIFKELDDTFGAAFATVEQALEASLAAQRGLSAERNGHAGERVRMALHTGVAKERDGDYFGPAVNRGARLLSAARGGQVLLSADTHGLVRDTLGFSELGAELRDLGEHQLEDPGDSEQIFELVVPDLPEWVPSPRPSDERYVPKKLIGSGGMADVYLARDRELDREVAFKKLRQHYAHDEEVVERFEREAKSAASLSHPNIVSVYDRGETKDGSYYIVMEHVPGGNLKERILEKGPLPPDEAAAIALQVARALEAAHERGVVHRDVKPENVLLTESGEAKVADFGIARAVAASTVTKTGFVVGTAHYLSPEQALGHPATPRSDLYSLGVVLYEMLTGELPHDAETPVGIVMKHVSGRLQPPRDVNPEVPEELDAVVVRLLARDPEDRYRDAVEVIEDLERVRRGEPRASVAAQQQAPSPATTPPEAREGDERRRWRWMPIPLILLLLALLAGATYAVGPWRSAPEVVVPDLVGASSIEEAREMAGDRFEVVEGDRVESREAVGTIVAQNPYAGEAAEEGSEISVDVVGTRIANLPDVEGKTREEAERILKEAGFEVKVKTAESSTEDENTVTGQDPKRGGETAEAGSTITITDGKGPANVEIPKIYSYTPEGARQVLEVAGLKLGSQTEVPNDRVPAGHIIEQQPAAGTEVEPGSTVDVVVSSGPQPPAPNAGDDAQPLGSTAPASTAPAMAADDDGEFEDEGEFENEFEDEFGDDDGSGPDHSGHGGPGRH